MLHEFLTAHLAQGGIAVIATHQDLALPTTSKRTLRLQ
jgi:ABC-type transport system involved in cytochrome c biogenesis ATPase subunit